MPATGNHALVHGLLSIVVGVAYAAAVLFLVQLVPIVGGGLAVAISTLAVAALLRPLWRRTQDAVNRRFSPLR
jgi:membrane protein implicated in regulation of membrane protease activity